MLAAQRNTPAEVFERAAHSSLRVGGIGQSTQRPRFRFGGIHAASIDKATFVLVLTAIDVPKREINVAPKEMNASECTRQLMLLGGFLGVVQQIQRFIEALADPKPLGQSDLRLTTGDAVR